MDSQEYYDFLQKFESRTTTDDCFTPPLIYDAVAEYVGRRYGLDPTKFLRPFIPGADYQKVEYKEGDVVVDNPPFSIISQICTWYSERGIKFFLFAPALTLFASARNSGCCAVCAGAPVTYDNGATANTSFITNLEPDKIAMSAPELRAMIREANRKNLEALKKYFPKYEYNANTLTATMLNFLSGHGVDFSVGRQEVQFTRTLDCQRPKKKSIYGGGFLISEKAAARKRAATEAAKRHEIKESQAVDEVWELSEREWAIVLGLA